MTNTTTATDDRNAELTVALDALVEGRIAATSELFNRMTVSGHVQTTDAYLAIAAAMALLEPIAYRTAGYNDIIVRYIPEGVGYDAGRDAKFTFRTDVRRTGGPKGAPADADAVHQLVAAGIAADAANPW